MSTVPTPRGSEAGTDERTLLLAWMQRLEGTMTDGFRDLTASVNKLRDESVHRREFDRYRDERVLAEREEEARLDRELAEIRQTHADDQARATSFRRWIVTSLIGATAAAGTVSGVVVAVATHR